jgi:hypothetical protein
MTELAGEITEIAKTSLLRKLAGRHRYRRASQLVAPGGRGGGRGEALSCPSG